MADKEEFTLEDLILRDRIASDTLNIYNDKQNELLKEYGKMNKEEMDTGIKNCDCDYVKKYYDFILTTKQAQMEAFILVMDHLENVQKTTMLTTDALEFLKKEIDEIKERVEVLDYESNAIIEAENGKQHDTDEEIQFFQDSDESDDDDESDDNDESDDDDESY